MARKFCIGKNCQYRHDMTYKNCGTCGGLYDHQADEINVQIGKNRIKGFSPESELKVEREKRPWWRVIEYAKDHPDYKENATTLAMIDKTGIEVTLSLKNGCDSLKEITCCDPYGENKFEIKNR